MNEFPCADCQKMEDDKCLTPFDCDVYMEWVIEGIQNDERTATGGEPKIKRRNKRSKAQDENPQ